MKNKKILLSFGFFFIMLVSFPQVTHAFSFSDLNPFSKSSPLNPTNIVTAASDAVASMTKGIPLLGDLTQSVACVNRDISNYLNSDISPCGGSSSGSTSSSPAGGPVPCTSAPNSCGLRNTGTIVNGICVVDPPDNKVISRVDTRTLTSPHLKNPYDGTSLYLGTYDDFKGGGNDLNGPSTQTALNTICSLAGESSATGHTPGVDYACVTPQYGPQECTVVDAEGGSSSSCSIPVINGLTAARHNGYNGNGGWEYSSQGQGWCTEAGVDWVQCSSPTPISAPPDSSCPAPSSTNGQCDNSAQVYCYAGTRENVNYTNNTWDCVGTGTIDHCTLSTSDSNPPPTSVNGSCTSKCIAFDSTTNSTTCSSSSYSSFSPLCSSGTLTSQDIYTSYSAWACNGSGGGADATGCSACAPGYSGVGCGAIKTPTPVITPPTSVTPSGTLTLTPASCTIAVGKSTCSVYARWTTQNATDPKLVDVNPNGNGVLPYSNVENQAAPGLQVWVAYSQTAFELRDGSTKLDTKTATASCNLATSHWDDVSRTCVATKVTTGTECTTSGPPCCAP